MAAIALDAAPLVRSVTIRVRGLKLASLRLRLAARLFEMAALVGGVGVSFDAGSAPSTGELAPVGCPNDPILYAKVGGPPADWHGLKVHDLDAGVELQNVVEADALEGWAVCNRTDAQGLFFLDQAGKVATVRLDGRFEIRRST